jgi:hypothetical protein
MRLHATQGFRGRLIDLETGRAVPRVLWFDPEQGEIEAYAVDEQGRYRSDGNGNLLTYRARGRFIFLPGKPTGQGPKKTVHLGAPRCAKCRSPLTLLGDDLCAPCRALDRNQKNRMKVERMDEFLLRRPCDYRGCSRAASWSVADEVEVTPQQRGRALYARGATVGRRFYCTFHYQPPRLLDARGEVVQVDEEAGGVRPD